MLNSIPYPLLISADINDQGFKIGGNDILAAITAEMVQAEYLFLMTDVECLYDKNPRLYQNAKAIELVEDVENIDADCEYLLTCLTNTLHSS
jgi:glutamate 5-kinase